MIEKLNVKNFRYKGLIKKGSTLSKCSNITKWWLTRHKYAKKWRHKLINFEHIMETIPEDIRVYRVSRKSKLTRSQRLDPVIFGNALFSVQRLEPNGTESVCEKASGKIGSFSHNYPWKNDHSNLHETQCQRVPLKIPV